MSGDEWIHIIIPFHTTGQI